MWIEGSRVDRRAGQWSVGVGVKIWGRTGGDEPDLFTLTESAV